MTQRNKICRTVESYLCLISKCTISERCKKKSVKIRHYLLQFSDRKLWPTAALCEVERVHNENLKVQRAGTLRELGASVQGFDCTPSGAFKTGQMSKTE